jgi:hypothetical protein
MAFFYLSGWIGCLVNRSSHAKVTGWDLFGCTKAALQCPTKDTCSYGRSYNKQIHKLNSYLSNCNWLGTFQFSCNLKINKILFLKNLIKKKWQIQTELDIVLIIVYLTTLLIVPVAYEDLIQIFVTPVLSNWILS